MCGVGAIFVTAERTLSDAHLSALNKMKKSLYLRGPDAQEIYHNNNIGLVHTRLSIIDPNERSNQPIESEDWVLSYNGEIYNHKDIRKDLEDKYTFRTSSDTEVLLLALQEWGIDTALEKSAGMFSFLAYNKREKILYAARDRMGIKPLFISRPEEGLILIASSPAAIYNALPLKDWQPYKPALASYFVLGAPFTTMSVIKDIERVEPAHYVKIYPNGMLVRHKYWEPEYQENFTFDDLINVVREHQISDVKSALFLSGGVDSTFIASVTDQLDYFHLKSPEAPYARQVAQKYGRPYIEVEPTLDNYEKGIEHTCSFQGEPYMSCGIPYAVSKAIAEKGYKMALSANGADELLFGYPRTPSLNRPFRKDAKEAPPSSWFLRQLSHMWPFSKDAREDPSSDAWFFRQLSHIFRDTRNFQIPEFAEYFPSLIDLGFNALKSYHLPNFPSCASYRWLELMTYVLHDLNPTLDAASMANSLEVRVPFLDHRIVQGILSWKSSDIISRKYGAKSPLKQWISKDFSHSFINRPKVGFSIDVGALKSIAAMSAANFATMQKSGFITFNNPTNYEHYLRDKIYLEQSCFVYDIWKKQLREI